MINAYACAKYALSDFLSAALNSEVLPAALDTRARGTFECVFYPQMLGIGVDECIKSVNEYGSGNALCFDVKLISGIERAGEGVGIVLTNEFYNAACMHMLDGVTDAAMPLDCSKQYAYTAARMKMLSRSVPHKIPEYAHRPAWLCVAVYDALEDTALLRVRMDAACESIETLMRTKWDAHCEWYRELSTFGRLASNILFAGWEKL